MIHNFMDNLARDIGCCCRYDFRVATGVKKTEQEQRLLSIGARVAGVGMLALTAIAAVMTLAAVLPAAPLSACLLLGVCAFTAALGYDACIVGDNLSRSLQPNFANLWQNTFGNVSTSPHDAVAQLLKNTVVLSPLRTYYLEAHAV